MKREKLTLTKEEANAILWEDGDGYEIIADNILDNGRWSIHHRLVIKRVSDGKYFADTYSVGATECQDERPWSYNAPNFVEVFPVEKKVIDYE